MRWLLFALACLSAVQAIGLLAIDYGSDSFKASFVGPGIPFDVLYNKDSKRKTTSLVSLHDEDRLIGGDALPSATRFPRDAFSSVKMVLSQTLLDLYRRMYKVTVNEGNGRSVTLQNAKGSDWSPEELIGMQLAYAKEMALSAAKGDKSFDTVITVPHHFGQLERKAILDAADLAGLRVLSLVNDGSAVAVNYAMTRTFPTADAKEIHLFYDSGAASTAATVVSFHTVPAASITSKNYTQVQVLGYGHALGLGGFHIDTALRDILYEAFQKDHKGKLTTPLKQNERAMAKLLKEASRVKHVLSANSEAVARVENLAEDVDFRATVTRQQLEEALADLRPLLEAPIKEALEMAGVKADDLTSAVLVGGSSRVPLVQVAVKNIIPEAKLAYNLNADESAVMGAALLGAGLSAQFRTKDIRVNDKTPFGIELSSGSQKDAVFPIYSKQGQKVTLEYKQLDNFTIEAKQIDSQQSSSPLLSASITGFEAALANLTEAELANATVKVIVALSESGVFSIDRAFFALPERLEAQTVADRIKNLFGGSKNKSDDASEVDGQENKTEDASKPVTKAAENKALALEVTYAPGYRPMSATEKVEAKKRLRDLEAAELRKSRREEARNGLESYLYSVRDLIESGPFGEASTDSERSKIKEILESTTEWMWSEGELAITKTLREKKTDLEKLVRIIQNRMEEVKERPAALGLYDLAIQGAEAFHLTALKNYTTELAENSLTRHTEDELSKFQELVKKGQEWYADAKSKQQKLAANVDSILKKAELTKRAKDLQAEMERLSRKKRPRKPYTPPSSSSSSSTTSTSSASEEPVETPRVKEEL